MTSPLYLVSIADFSGPMDLLVYLVKQRELDVAFISVSEIAADYLRWWHDTIEHLYNQTPVGNIDLDPAGEFVFLAAVLLEYKASLLLPGTEAAIEVDFDQDWRQRTFVDISVLQNSIEKLASLQDGQAGIFDRGELIIEGLDDQINTDLMANVSVYDIAKVFQELTSNFRESYSHIVAMIPYTIEGQMAYILSFFNNTKSVSFDRVAESFTNKMEIIVTFLAILELMRRNKIVVRQSSSFEPLILVYREEGYNNTDELNLSSIS